MEPLKLWDFVDAVYRSLECCRIEHSMGQPNAADACDLDAGSGYCMAGKKVAYHFDLCVELYLICLFEKLDYRRSFLC